MASTRLRPILSPRGPQKIPPSGRMRNESAKPISVNRTAFVEFSGNSALAMYTVP